MTENVWDTGRWAGVKAVKFDFMTHYIAEHLENAISFRNKTVLELGAGTGRLSYLALKSGAKKVYLVDSSKKAIALSRELFHDEPKERYEIIESDILGFGSGNAFDIVFSSGVIEHFKNEDRRKVIRKHVELASRDCLLVHPSDTLYNALFNKFPLAVRQYGYQKSFSQMELDGYLRGANDSMSVTHRRFQPCYTMPGLHNSSFINRSVDRTCLGKRWGGLTLTHISKTREGA